MPHVIVKLWPGRSEAQKEALSQRMAQALSETMGSSDGSISVAIEEVPSERWMDEVYAPEIAPNLDRLYKKPGYGPA